MGEVTNNIFTIQIDGGDVEVLIRYNEEFNEYTGEYTKELQDRLIHVKGILTSNAKITSPLEIAMKGQEENG